MSEFNSALALDLAASGRGAGYEPHVIVGFYADAAAQTRTRLVSLAAPNPQAPDELTLVTNEIAGDETPISTLWRTIGSAGLSSHAISRMHLLQPPDNPRQVFVEREHRRLYLPYAVHVIHPGWLPLLPLPLAEASQKIAAHPDPAIRSLHGRVLTRVGGVPRRQKSRSIHGVQPSSSQL